MAQTTQLSITTSAWTQVSGVTAGMLVNIEARFAFYTMYSNTTPALSEGYLIEDDKDTASSVCNFSDVALGTLWLRSKNINQTVLVTTGSDVGSASYAPYSIVSVTIASGQNTSGEIDTQGKQIVAIIFPAAFTGATVKLQSSLTSGGTFRDVNQVDSTSVYNISVAVDDHQPLDLWATYGLGYVKIVSASNEGSQRTLQVVLK